MSKPTEKSINRPLRDINGVHSLEAAPAYDDPDNMTIEGFAQRILSSGITAIVDYSGDPETQLSVAMLLASKFLNHGTPIEQDHIDLS